MLARVFRFIEEQGAVPGMQLAQAERNWSSRAPWKGAHPSSGLLAGIPIPISPGYQTPFAKQISPEANVLTAAVGIITEPEQADQIIGGKTKSPGKSGA